MAGITNYAGLRSAIADWLIRTDLSDSTLNTFIDNAERVLKRDHRVRKLFNVPLTVNAETVTLPADYRELESLYHDGPTYYGDIETVDGGSLAEIKRRVGNDTGVPRYAAIVDGVARFGPEPDGTYTLRLEYWATIEALSSTNLSNWLLDENPDIYLYASLVETAPYLRDDPRLAVWKTELESRLEALHDNTVRGQYSGTLTRRVKHPIP